MGRPRRRPDAPPAFPRRGLFRVRSRARAVGYMIVLLALLLAGEAVRRRWEGFRREADEHARQEEICRHADPSTVFRSTRLSDPRPLKARDAAEAHARARRALEARW